MGENSKIEWTDHTFNPWIGCTKVSPACTNCYAEVETFTRIQRAKGRELWGPNGDRHVTSDDNWSKPRRWDSEAEKSGERRRVFCASLADVFEDRPDLDAPRQRLFDLIVQSTNLDWLLLTKRPENVNRMVPAVWLEDWPPFVWVGTTVENQEMADKRIQQLLRIPARTRFLSCEPLLGPVDLNRPLWPDEVDKRGSLLKGAPMPGITWSKIDWVICGGESGPKARETNLDWIHSMVEQCGAADVPVFVKQLGSKPYYLDDQTKEKKPFPIKDTKGGVIGDFPCHFHRQFPEVK